MTPKEINRCMANLAANPQSGQEIAETLRSARNNAVFLGNLSYIALFDTAIEFAESMTHKCDQ